ncbi:hypothetical protein HYW83_02485 [Candidatus Peregrinibacteria bacterium]|nr:hypothetical protein [Candidatus Peregrinibacteria bacterium]
MTENPTGDEEVRRTSTGERIPSQDLIVGELSFGIDEEIIREAARARPQEAELLETDGLEIILQRIRELYDGIVALEKQGLRGDDLYWAVKSDPKLWLPCSRYYGFYRGPVWGARQQGVWFARDPKTGKR